MDLVGMGLVAGLAAAPHCLGMCGGFPLHVARSVRQGGLLTRQLLYLGGKTFTYIFLGAVIGFVGEMLVHSGWMVGSRKLLAGAAGVVMVVFGLQMVGLTPRLLGKGLNVQDWGPIKSLYDHFFRSPGPWAAFMLGLLTGFLPCPVTAAMLVAAAAVGSAVGGMLIMGAVGLGTAPVLLAVGLSGGLLTARFKAIGLRAAGVVVIILGVLTILRSTDLLHGGHDHGHHASARGSQARHLAGTHHERL